MTLICFYYLEISTLQADYNSILFNVEEIKYELEMISKMHRYKSHINLRGPIYTITATTKLPPPPFGGIFVATRKNIY